MPVLGRGVRAVRRRWRRLTTGRPPLRRVVLLALTALPWLLLCPGLASSDTGLLLPLPHVSPAAPAPPVLETLGNGLRVLCIENPSTHTVAVSAFIKSSARAETTTLAGIRNFVADAVVECSAYGRPEVAERIQEMGANVLVASATDFTEISLLAAAEDVELASALLHDILFQADFRQDAVDRLRRDLTLAATRSGELGELAAERTAVGRLYPNHPYGWPVEGLAASIIGFSLEDVLRVYRGSYLANNILLVVAGGVPARASLEVVRRHYSLALPGQKLPESQREPMPVRSGTQELRRPGGSAIVYVGARAPGASDPAYPAASIALAVLGSGMGSMLYDSLRREEGIAYVIDASATSARDASRARLMVSCPPELAGRAEALMLRDIRQLTREAPSPEEIQRAKEYICTSYALSHQRSAKLAHQLGAFQVAADEGYELDWELPRRVRQTTAEQVRDAAQVMFANPVIVRAMP